MVGTEQFLPLVEDSQSHTGEGQSHQSLQPNFGKKARKDPEVHQFIFLLQQLVLLRALLCRGVIRGRKRKFQAKISGYWKKYFNAKSICS